MSFEQLRSNPIMSFEQLRSDTEASSHRRKLTDKIASVGAQQYSAGVGK